MKRFVLMFLCVWPVIAQVGAVQVRAEEIPSQDSATARTLFMQGTRAAKDGDWARARDAFAASYALHQSPRTLFNLGIARIQVGELVAGSEALRVFLRSGDPVREADNIDIAQKELLRIEPLIAYVRVDATAMSASDQLEVDGRILPRAAVGTELPLDPGGHHVRWLRPERVIDEARFEVKPGERATVALELSAEPEPAPVVSVPPPNEVTPPPATLAQDQAPALATSPLPGHDDMSRRKRRWLIGGGVAAAVVGAALATFFITRKDETKREYLEPVDGNVVDGVVRIP